MNTLILLLNKPRSIMIRRLKDYNENYDVKVLRQVDQLNQILFDYHTFDILILVTIGKSKHNSKAMVTSSLIKRTHYYKLQKHPCLLFPLCVSSDCCLQRRFLKIIGVIPSTVSAEELTGFYIKQNKSLCEHSDTKISIKIISCNFFSCCSQQWCLSWSWDIAVSKK